MAITIKIERQPTVSKELFREFLAWKREKENAEYTEMLEKARQEVRGGNVWQFNDGKFVRPNAETIEAVKKLFRKAPILKRENGTEMLEKAQQEVERGELYDYVPGQKFVSA
ncbi:MAG: hypothetical protein LBC38_00340 [Oscillospiraceae bacterium]|jgi:anthranilate/para-aminobenzoate synthase component I|nr:hypothetical protein [Oscillospiraceae bacterium]